MIDKVQFSVFLIRLILATAGLSSKDDNLRYLNHTALVIFTNLQSISLITLYLYFEQLNANVIWIIVSNLVHIGNYFATWMIMYRNRDTLTRIMNALKINVYRYPDQMVRFTPTDVTDSSATFILLVIFYTSYFIILLVPAVFTILTHSPPSLNGLMYPCWYPWTVDTTVKYTLTYTWQLFGGIFSCYFMPVFMLFVVHFVFIVQEQRNILYKVLRNIRAYEATKVKDIETHRGHELWNHLVECMKHHSAIIKFINDFVSCYKWVFVLNLLYSTMIFTINCYILIGGNNDWKTLMQTIFELSLVFPYFFVYCYIGEVFKDVNTVLKELIYDIDWYDKSIQFRKSVLLLLSVTTPEINLKFSQKLVASYMLFASVLRASYTYANLMLNIQR